MPDDLDPDNSDDGNVRTPADPAFVGVKAAAEFLSVSESVVRVAMFDGRLPYQTAYGRKVIALTDLEAYKDRTQPDGQPRRGRPRKS